MSELDGFVIYKTDQRSRRLFIRVNGQKHFGISTGVWNVLGKPEYINAFLDENKGRVMLKSAEKDYENAMKVSTSKQCRGIYVSSQNLMVKLHEMFPNRRRVPGHVAGDGIVIFQEGE